MEPELLLGLGIGLPGRIVIARVREGSDLLTAIAEAVRQAGIPVAIGTGFDPAQLEGGRPARLGLLTMIERAGYAQGVAQVVSAPGSGTRVRLVLPWNPGNPDGDPDPSVELLPELARAVGTPPGSP